MDEKPGAGIKLYDIPEVAGILHTTPSAIRMRISRGTLGPREGLRYVFSKPYFLADVLHQQIRGGKLARQRGGRDGKVR